MSKKERRSVPVLRFKGFTDDWEQRKLQDISERINRKNEKLESNLPLTISAQYGLVDQKNFFNKQVASKNLKNYILLKKGEFAYNKSYSKDLPYGAIKRLNLYSQGVISSLYIAFKPVNVNSNFLEQYFNSNKWYKEIYRNAAEGARNHGLLNIAPKDFFSSSLNIPSDKTEQKDISNLLFKLDKLLSLQQRKLDRLKEIRKSYLSKIFPNKRENRPSLKFNNLKNTSWKPHKLKDIVTNVETGKSKVKLQPKGKYPVLGSTSIIGYNDHYDYSGDFILIARVGAYAGKMYRFSGSVKITDNTVFIQSAYNTFLYYYLRNFNLKKLSFGSGQPLVKSSELKSLSILIPSSKEEIKAISRLSIIFDNLINVQEKKVSSIRQIKKFLLQNMFT